MPERACAAGGEIAALVRESAAWGGHGALQPRLAGFASARASRESIAYARAYASWYAWSASLKWDMKVTSADPRGGDRVWRGRWARLRIDSRSWPVSDAEARATRAA